jgi:hypothetical protein
MINDRGTKLRKNPAITYFIYLFTLAAMGIYYSMSGLFPSHKSITRITNYQDSEFYKTITRNNPKKVILLLIDGLSEDFVEISDISSRRTNYKDSNYYSPKITIFQELSDN